MRSHRSGAEGVVGIDAVFQNAFLEEVPFWTTPAAPLKEASRLLLDVASTPPMSGGEWHAQFIHTFSDPVEAQPPLLEKEGIELVSTAFSSPSTAFRATN